MAETVRIAKTQFKLHEFFVWHTAFGLPCGLHPEAENLSAFHPRRREQVPLPRVPLDGILSWWDADHASLPDSPDDELAFLKAMHDRLRAAGVDGVKIDFQAVCAFHSGDDGGRATAGRELAKALEESTSRHFGSERVSCMACIPELLYSAPRSHFFRASDDFIPGDSATWGGRIRNCATMALWFGRFVRLDWDMFLSSSAAPAWHAATRALSGGPVYVADPPGATDGALLRRLANENGFVPRFPGSAVPTRDSLFLDPEAEPERAFAIANGSSLTGAVGVFDLDPGGPAPKRPRFADIRASDIPRLSRARRYAAWNAASGDVQIVSRDEALRVEAGGPDRFAVISFAPVRNNTFAPLGVLPYLIPAVGIIEVSKMRTPGLWRIRLSVGGTFVAWCARKPVEIRLAGVLFYNVPPLRFNWDSTRSLVFVDVPDDPSTRLISISFDDKE